MEVTLRELLYDEEFIAKLYGWSYNHNFDRIAAEELSQEIILQLLIASQTVKYDYTYAYIWKIAENTYNRTTRQTIKHGNHAEYDHYINVNTDTNMEDDIITAIVDSADYDAIRSQISYMSKIYRDVMVMFYFDGLQMNEIADKLNIPLNRVKQRLHTAKEKIKKEVTNMSNNIALKPYKLDLSGSGNPLKFNPRDQLQSVITQNIAYVCRNKAKTPSEIATELSVPTVFIEDLISKMIGEALKDCGDGKYITNFIIVDESEALAISDELREIAKNFVAEAIVVYNNEKDNIMSNKFLNLPKSFEFLMWSIVPHWGMYVMRQLNIIVEKHFNIPNEHRDFKVVGTAFLGERNNVQQYSSNGMSNDTFRFRSNDGYRLPWNKSRFGYSETVPAHIEFITKCIGGLNKDDVAEDDIEACAQAIDVGYISLADDGKYYPEIIIFDKEPNLPNIADISDKYSKQLGQTFIAAVKKYVPEHLMNQKDIFVTIMAGPIQHHIIEEAISQGFLYIPEGDTIVESIFVIKK